MPDLLACMQKNEELANFLLENGAGASANSRSTSQLTAADYARLHGLHAVASRLDAVASSEQANDLSPRCPICSETLKRKSKLQYLQELFASGMEANPLVCLFFTLQPEVADALQGAAYHRLNQQRTLRKEISETMAVVRMLQGVLRREADRGVGHIGKGKQQLPSAQPEQTKPRAKGGVQVEGSRARTTPRAVQRLHVIDLCCGKSLTACYISLLYPEFVVTPIDCISPHALPHFPSTTQFQRLDLYDADFERVIGAHIQSVGLPVCVLGMHLCGDLSMVAVHMLHNIPLVQDLLLCPCCLPNQHLDTSEAVWYADGESSVQYSRWVDHLALQMAQHVQEDGVGGGDGMGGEDGMDAAAGDSAGGVSAEGIAQYAVQVHYEEHVLSERRAIIHGQKVAASGSHGSIDSDDGSSASSRNGANGQASRGGIVSLSEQEERREEKKGDGADDDEEEEGTLVHCTGMIASVDVSDRVVSLEQLCSGSKKVRIKAWIVHDGCADIRPGAVDSAVDSCGCDSAAGLILCLLILHFPVLTMLPYPADLLLQAFLSYSSTSASSSTSSSSAPSSAPKSLNAGTNMPVGFAPSSPGGQQVHNASMRGVKPSSDRLPIAFDVTVRHLQRLAKQSGMAGGGKFLYGDYVVQLVASGTTSSGTLPGGSATVRFAVGNATAP
jgi:hypothetical protein